MGGAQSLSEAWLDADSMPRDDANLLQVQKEALQNNEHELALLVYSCYGIASVELFSYIRWLRDLVRNHTKLVRDPGLTPEEERERKDEALESFRSYSFSPTSYGYKPFNLDPTTG